MAYSQDERGYFKIRKYFFTIALLVLGVVLVTFGWYCRYFNQQSWQSTACIPVGAICTFFGLVTTMVLLDTYGL
jgi:uncharacterized protein (DUF486 family)